MLVLRQFTIVAAGCVLGALMAGIYLTASPPAATRSLDYLLTAVGFLVGFAAGTWLAGGLSSRTAGSVGTVAPPPPPLEPEALGDLAPLRVPTPGQSFTPIR